jgi:hypothetical protein
MNKQTPSQQATPAADAAAPEAAAQPGQRAISDPREVAAVVMARMNTVKAKKQELGAAIDALVDITQQLTRTYGAQMVAMEQMRRRIKALEAQVAAQTPNPPETVQ